MDEIVVLLEFCSGDQFVIERCESLVTGSALRHYG